ncbi:ABC transporter ATP-binding protein [Xanthobacter dioxanivorans]|uniref:ABC transporter ATP-binding protein n=1 Tax=Xanthobacter dioxanivorans TaxID=2528964 RepID=A0A974SKQ7_9HYPH|nr:ABC transporter ATP-binding protein [Xanthobacter dioxanivorans]QRG07778.1 ABC transporter ATP-binding protein [Xanthobacter dioxanivorans]
MLELIKVTSGYGTVAAVEGVDMRVPKGACVCLIGANGAGKTTTLLTICGLVRAFSGTVRIDGKDLTASPADKIVRAGVSLVPEGRRVVANMSVEDNLRVGAYVRGNDPQVPQDMERIYARFPRLRERRLQYAGSLSGGEQQMLAMGRALMARPRLLLLDEPSMGLAPHVVNDIFATIRDINAQGTTVLLVEQNARKALSVSDYGYVMEHGRIVFGDTSEALGKDPRVVAAYLGMRATADTAAAGA